MMMDTIKIKLPKRKSPRLKGFNYNTSGYYFITICTCNKAKTLCKVGAIHESPETILSEQGRIVDDVINNLPSHLGVKIDKYVIMPNHIHFILVVDKNNLSRAIRESPLQMRSAVDKTVGYTKMNVSKRIHQEISKEIVWQRSYHDHIIRDEKDYLKIWQYIDNNPIKWEYDCFYTKT